MYIDVKDSALVKLMITGRRLLFVYVVFVLTGCTANVPAPVVAINSPVQKNYNKGSLKADYYRVRRGDTLYSISWASNKDFVTIVKNNRLKKPYTIYPGQVLRLKKVTVTKKIPRSSTTSVKKGSAAHKNRVKSGKNNHQVVTAKKKKTTKKSLDQGHNTAYSEKAGKTASSGKKHRTKPQALRWRWPAKGRLITRFSTGEQGNKGINIAGSKGAPIRAAAGGRIVYAGNGLRGYGNLVIIKHNDDYLSAYAHTNAILVKEKQSVKAGQTVARMGQTGTTRVMLHFEIRYHGKSVNPLKYLPKN